MTFLIQERYRSNGETHICKETFEGSLEELQAHLEQGLLKHLEQVVLREKLDQLFAEDEEAYRKVRKNIHLYPIARKLYASVTIVSGIDLEALEAKVLPLAEVQAEKTWQAAKEAVSSDWKESG